MLDAVAVAEDLRELGHRLRQERGVLYRRDLERRRFGHLESNPWYREHDATAAASLCGCLDLPVRTRGGRQHDGDCGVISIWLHKKDSHQLRTTNQIGRASCRERV